MGIAFPLGPIVPAVIAVPPGIAVPNGITARMPALASPLFRRFLVGAMAASVGGFMQSTAQGWLVLGLTNSAEALGVISALQILPILLLSAVAGVLADRIDWRRLLASTQLGSAGVAVVLAILATTGVIQFWQVAVLAIMAGTATAIQNPAYQAIVPNLVEREVIGSAVALNSAQFNLSRILGPSIAGAAIAAGGLGLAFWGNALALCAVTWVFWGLRVPGARATARAQASMWSNMLDGVRYVRSRRIVAVLVLLAAVPALFLLNYLMLLPVFARDVLQIGAPGLGLLSAGIGIGALTGALGLATLRPSGGSGRSLIVALVVGSLAEVVFAASRFVPLSIAALAVLGGCQVIYYATTNTLLQVLVPGRLRGRVMSLYILSSWGLIPFGNLLAGVVAERATPTLALAGGSLLTLLAAVGVALLVPELRRLEAGSGSLSAESLAAAEAAPEVA
ncbi:MAG: MFS transporter [Chloroflexota bacterium]